MPDLNIFKIDFKNLAKLSREGKIVKVYRAMYREAERLAVKELKLFMGEIAVTKGETGIARGIEMIANYRRDQIAYHMNEMKQLLEMSLKAQSKEK